MKKATEDRAEYSVHSDDAIIAQATAILQKRLRAPGIALSSPDTVKLYLRTKLADRDHEIFVVMFLDAKNRLIKTEEMFRGTLTHASVYPREVVKGALGVNAAAVMLCHNHPSGSSDPSDADLILTRALKGALELVDVKTLDHFIVAGLDVHSFAEHGQI